jgi:hypothetical protein
LLIPGSAPDPRAGFGGRAEIFGLQHYIHSEQKVRDGEEAIASTQAACTPRNENRRDR